jgi:hypothetical protein
MSALCQKPTFALQQKAASRSLVCAMAISNLRGGAPLRYVKSGIAELPALRSRTTKSERALRDEYELPDVSPRKDD